MSKYLRQFPGRHLLNRIEANRKSLTAYLEQWEQDQRVSRVVCFLHFKKGLSFREIEEWLRGGPSWGKRTANQVRRIVEAARKDVDILGGGRGESEEPN